MYERNTVKQLIIGARIVMTVQLIGLDYMNEMD
jgi:hypothetical protein